MRDDQSATLTTTLPRHERPRISSYASATESSPYQKWRIPLMSIKAARRTSPKSVASCSETANSPG